MNIYVYIKKPMFFVSFKGYGETRPPTIGARRRERTTTLPLPLGGGALPAASLPLPSTASIYDRSGHGAVVGSSARGSWLRLGPRLYPRRSLSKAAHDLSQFCLIV